MHWCKFMVWFQVGLVLVIPCHKFNRRCLIQITSCSKCSCQNINLNKIFTTHIFFQLMDLLLNFPICWFCASVYFLINWQIFEKKPSQGFLVFLWTQADLWLFCSALLHICSLVQHTQMSGMAVYLWVISFSYRLHPFILADTQEILQPHLTEPESLPWIFWGIGELSSVPFTPELDVARFPCPQQSWRTALSAGREPHPASPSGQALGSHSWIVGLFEETLKEQRGD